MAFQKIENVRIAGISASVPSYIENNRELTVFSSKEDAEKFITTTGIRERRIASFETCSSDLCYHAANKLISELSWNKSDIDCLIFITQTPDYIVPATSCILQDRLGLSTECYTFDLTLGCSGWVYGLSVMASLISSGYLKKGLLLVGETTTKTKSPTDKSTYPLFGDAGTATCLEYSPGTEPMYFHCGTEGSKHKAIYIPDGAFRNPVTPESLVSMEIEPGIIRNRVQYIMDGGSVFIFSITRPVQSIKMLLENTSVYKEDIDYFFLHQANKIMVEKIIEKLKVSPEKSPTSYELFGNTSMSSIPLTMITKKRSELENSSLKLITCGFGGGLSWSSGYIITDRIVCPELLEI
jgi:3-oxoacyl-[acyl-carrier-protein] synthase-3